MGIKRKGCSKRRVVWPAPVGGGQDAAAGAHDSVGADRVQMRSKNKRSMIFSVFRQGRVTCGFSRARSSIFSQTSSRSFSLYFSLWKTSEFNWSEFSAAIQRSNSGAYLLGSNLSINALVRGTDLIQSSRTLWREHLILPNLYYLQILKKTFQLLVFCSWFKLWTVMVSWGALVTRTVCAVYLEIITFVSRPCIAVSSRQTASGSFPWRVWGRCRSNHGSSWNRKLLKPMSL